MSDIFDIEPFVKEPGLLIRLCFDVIDRIDADSADPNAGEKEAQLREIARTIERLEKMSVPVPDVLRAEKTKLAAALGIHGNVNQDLLQLANEFDSIIINIRSRLTRENGSLTGNKKRTYGPRSSSPKSLQSFFCEYIINALKKLGGRARTVEVLNEMGKKLDGKLLPGDFELLKDGKTVGWHNSAQWERVVMVKKGILRNDSPRGIWELSESYR